MPYFLAPNVCNLSKLQVFIFLLIPFFAQAQSHRAWANAAHTALEEGDCQAAMQYFKEARLKRPSKAAYIYGFAQAAKTCNVFKQAAKAFKSVLADYEDAYYHLALVQKGLGDYAQAKASFAAYLAQAPTSVYAASARQEISNCEYALTQKPNADYSIKNMGRKINSDYSEFAPVWHADTLFYSSYRFKSKKNNKKISKVLFSTPEKKGKPMKYRFNDPSEFTANICFLPDNSGVYYTQCHYQDGQNIHCNLYFRARKKRGWQTPIKLAINSQEYTSTHPSYYVDNQTNKPYLLFSSDRPNGKGKTDIWMAPILDNHQLGTAINLEAINTAEAEMSPFFEPTKKELFFSSTGHTNIGGFDVFKIKATQLPFLDGVVKPLPQPINSPANDLFYTAKGDGKSGYLASNRVGARLIDKQNERCCNDLYQWDYTAPKTVKPSPKDTLLAITSPLEQAIKLPTNRPAIASNPIPTGAPILDTLLASLPPISLRKKIKKKPVPKASLTKLKKVPISSWSMLPIKLYFDNDQPDNRTLATTTEQTYFDTFEPYRKRRVAFIQSYCAALTGVERDEAAADITHFFRQDVKSGGENLRKLSARILDTLKTGQKVSLIIKGYTSPRAETNYNDFLAARRISSLKNHFTAYQAGILKPFLNTGQLNFSALPLGESEAPLHINDQLVNRRQSIYGLAASLERRVEIVGILITP